MGDELYGPCSECGETTRHVFRLAEYDVAPLRLCRARVCRVAALSEVAADADSKRYLTEDADGVLPEYDFSGGERGRYVSTPVESVAGGALADIDCTCNPAVARGGRCVNCGGVVSG